MSRFAKIAVGGAAAVMLFMTASVVLAVVPDCSNDPYGLNCSAPSDLKNGVAGSKDIPAIAGSIVNIALSLIGIVFFLLILYAGFNWMIARGNTEKVDQSKAIIEGAIIGLIIVMSAYAITTFVFTGLSSSGGSQSAVEPGSIVCDTSSLTCAGINSGSQCGSGATLGTCRVSSGTTCTCVQPQG